MKWLRNRIILPLRKPNWNIKLYQVGDYQLIEITDPMFRMDDVPSIYLTLLDFIFKDCQTIVLCQFIDESQGMLNNKDQVLADLPNKYGAKVFFTKDYVSLIHPPDKSREYVINIIGKPSSEWIRKVIAYGGTSLSNIIYGVENLESDWQEVAVKRNQRFMKVYRLEVEDVGLNGIKQEVKMLCWTSDTHIFALLEPDKVNALLTFIAEVAEQYSLTAKFENKQGSY